jgi:polysaccharide biosynthesis PFTS motif protein
VQSSEVDALRRPHFTIIGNMKTWVCMVLDKLRIILGLDSKEHSRMSEKHSQLIESGFYKNLRKTLNDIYLEDREVLESEVAESNLDKIDIYDLKLLALQKTALLTVHNNKFKQAISYSKLFETSIYYPISYAMQERVKKIGLEFNPIISHLMYSTLSTLISLYRTFKILRFSRHHTHLRQNCSNLIWVDGLTRVNFPTKENPNFNLVAWMCHQTDEKTTFMHDCKDVEENIQIGEHLLCYSPSPYEQHGFFFKTWIVLRSLCNLLRLLSSRKFSWNEAVLILPDVLMYNFARSSSIRYDQIFSLSTRLVSKPLWFTYSEKLGTQVLLLNYAIAAEPSLPTNPYTQDGIWQLSSWNKSFVIDHQQVMDFSKLTSYHPSDFVITGPPFWGGKPVPLDFGSKVLVAVFDTGIQSCSTFSAGILDELGWKDFNLELQFIEMIMLAVQPFDVIVAHKRKRSVSDHNSAQRERNLSKLKSIYGNKYESIPEDVSADCLISKSAVVVSKPISTTAVSAANLGKHSVFLDPTGNLISEDPSLRGIPLIHSQIDLNAYFKSIF